MNLLSPEGLQILKIKASKSEEDARGRGELVWMTGGEIRVEVSCSAQRGAQEDWGEDDQLCLGAQTARVPRTCSSTTIPVFLQLVCHLHGGEALQAAVFQEQIGETLMSEPEEMSWVICLLPTTQGNLSAERSKDSSWR